LVAIPNSVQIIGAACFSHYPMFTAMVFDQEAKLKTIEDRAFAGCQFAAFVVLREMETIGGEAFRGCDKLAEVLFEDDTL
jgi:hypothetical protein